MGQSRPLLCFIFCSFLFTISIQIEKSIHGVIGIRTQCHRMVGTDETTELWRPPRAMIVSKECHLREIQLSDLIRKYLLFSVFYILVCSFMGKCYKIILLLKGQRKVIFCSTPVPFCLLKIWPNHHVEVIGPIKHLPFILAFVLLKINWSEM